MGEQPSIKRRTFLTGMMLAPLALSGCEDFPNDPLISPHEVTALRKVAESPGSAVAKLAALPPHPWRRVYKLPFATDAVPGFSAATHRLNHEHDYMDYLYQWLTGEQKLVGLASAVASVSQTAPEDLARVATIGEEIRVAANRVILLELYWERFWDRTAFDVRSVRGIANEVRRTRRRPSTSWVISTGGEDATAFEEKDSVPFNTVPEVAIHCMPRAWALDFATLKSYLSRLLSNMPLQAFESMQMSYSHWGSASSDDLSRYPDYGMESARRASNGNFDAEFGEIAAARGFADPDRIVEGLRRMARKDGYVAILGRMGKEDRTLAIIRPELTSGIWEHGVLSVKKGVG